VHAKRDLVVAVGPSGHRERQVVEDPLVEAVHDGEAMGRGQINARLPLDIAAFLAADGRNLELHEISSSLPVMAAGLLRQVYQHRPGHWKTVTHDCTGNGCELSANFPQRISACPA
jgi:hypothetical protein